MAAVQTSLVYAEILVQEYMDIQNGKVGIIKRASMNVGVLKKKKQKEFFNMKARFANKQEFEDFLQKSFICICGRPLTGLHELTCRKIQEYKLKFFGKQDTHPIVRIPKVTK